MKRTYKYLMVLPVVVLLLASCAKSDLEQTSGNQQILLSSGVNTLTKADNYEPSNTQIAKGQKIGLFVKENADPASTTYTQNLAFTADGNGNLSGDPLYYPKSGNGVKMSAYHPFMFDAYRVVDFIVNTDQTIFDNYYWSDLMYSPEKEYPRQTGAHQIVFDHLLSRLTFTLIPGKGNPDLNGAKIKILNVFTRAEFNPFNGECEVPTIFPKSDIKVGEFGAIIPPQHLFIGERFIEIETVYGNYYVRLDKEFSTKPGMSYHFDLTVNQTEVTFKYTVEEWVFGDAGAPNGTMMDDVESSDIESNTFVVRPNQRFVFPIAKAYDMWKNTAGLAAALATEAVTTLSDDVTAEVIWMDNPQLLSALILGENLGRNAKIEVRVPARMEGNAVIGVRINGEIRWSWHIWVTGEDPFRITYPYDNNNDGTADYVFMDRNLGALSNTVGKPASQGLLYQWGRKDPFTGTTNWNGTNFTKMYDRNGNYINTGSDYEIFLGDKNEPLSYFVMNPNYLSKGSLNEMLNPDLWGGESNKKSAFDPCPKGWKVPNYVNDKDPWNGLTKPTGQNYDSQNGWIFDESGKKLGYWPKAQARNMFGKATSTGVYWTAQTTNPANFAWIYDLKYNYMFDYSKGEAYSVRCVKE